ncbi:MAG: hypothetical protein QOJ65_1025, partial [Fimbriimonadaceae bacterium]|nr:hypothetical protein [Fimbriimonadaceae bacterium]
FGGHGNGATCVGNRHLRKQADSEGTHVRACESRKQGQGDGQNWPKESHGERGKDGPRPGKGSTGWLEEPPRIVYRMTLIGTILRTRSPSVVSAMISTR